MVYDLGFSLQSLEKVAEKGCNSERLSKMYWSYINRI